MYSAARTRKVTSPPTAESAPRATASARGKLLLRGGQRRTTHNLCGPKFTPPPPGPMLSVLWGGGGPAHWGGQNFRKAIAVEIFTSSSRVS
eukprot:2793756-Pyramimonas_sp.AAC.1